MCADLQDHSPFRRMEFLLRIQTHVSHKVGVLLSKQTNNTRDRLTKHT